MFLFILGTLCDLVFVFFDPIGQALCKRTLNIVGKIIFVSLISEIHFPITISEKVLELCCNGKELALNY